MTAQTRPDSENDSVGLSILIPCYNEAGTIARIIDRVLAVPFPVATELIVVDDGSRDGSADILRRLPGSQRVRVYFHDVNKGKGCAVQTALAHASGRYVVIQDADEELDPTDLLKLLEVVRGGDAPVCYGSRFKEDVRAFRRLPTYWANRVLNGICNLLNGIRLTDMNTCYKMMRIDVARRLNLQSRGFAMEPEITTKLARMGIAIAEHPIRYTPRGRGEGKKIRFADFFRYIKAMLRFRFARMDGSSG